MLMNYKSLDKEVETSNNGEGYSTEVNFAFVFKPTFSTLGSNIEVSLERRLKI